tara:strand:+ start:39 stop:593 length:555 start_codon:yes stop_codon:yes gene_type:complete
MDSMVDNTINTGRKIGSTRFFEDGEWWYAGQSNGRRRVAGHEKKNHTRMFVNGKYIPKTHPLFKAGRYKSFGDADFATIQRDTKVKEGYVYAISNAAWPDWIKIGKAEDIDKRYNSYQTSSPMRDYKLIHSVYFDDRNAAELKAHTIAQGIGARKNEWFKLTEDQALEVLMVLTPDRLKEMING